MNHKAENEFTAVDGILAACIIALFAYVIWINADYEEPNGWYAYGTTAFVCTHGGNNED